MLPLPHDAAVCIYISGDAPGADAPPPNAPAWSSSAAPTPTWWSAPRACPSLVRLCWAASSPRPPGGKGANQAVAAARLGALVTFVACVGADALGDQAVLGYEAEGIDTRHVVRDPDAPTGVALITVDETSGENCIVAAPGANACLSVEPGGTGRRRHPRGRRRGVSVEVPAGTRP